LRESGGEEVGVEFEHGLPFWENLLTKIAPGGRLRKLSWPRSPKKISDLG
jgi:hypothetical protein